MELGRILTDVPLLQKRQCLQSWSTCVIIEDECVTLVVDIWSGEELNRGSDYSGDEEDEEDKGQQHHGDWEQSSLRNEDDFDNDEDYSQCADCDTVGHDPKEFVSTIV